MGGRTLPARSNQCPALSRDEHLTPYAETGGLLMFPRSDARHAHAIASGRPRDGRYARYHIRTHLCGGGMRTIEFVTPWKGGGVMYLDGEGDLNVLREAFSPRGQFVTC